MLIETKCFVCGKQFTTYNYNSKRHFCSRKCYSSICYENFGKWTKSELIGKRNKEKWFSQKVSEGLKKYFLKNPRTQEKWYIERYGYDYTPKKVKHSDIWRKMSARLRSKHGCARCEVTKNLDIHHIVPFAISKDNSITNVVVLCKRCHKFTEDNNIKIFNIVKNWDIVRLLYKYSFEDIKGKVLRYE